MTADEILNQYLETGGNPELIMIRVTNLISAAIVLLEKWAEDQSGMTVESFFEIRELLKISMETIDSEPVQVLFDNINRNYKNHE